MTRREVFPIAYVATVAVWPYGPRDGDDEDAALPVAATTEKDAS
jgi:hypothetical protein